MSEQKETALVTGASSGIGRVTALKLAEKGFAVIAAARRKERLVEMADQVEGITPVQVDLSRQRHLCRLQACSGGHHGCHAFRIGAYGNKGGDHSPRPHCHRIQ